VAKVLTHWPFCDQENGRERVVSLLNQSRALLGEDRRARRLRALGKRSASRDESALMSPSDAGLVRGATLFSAKASGRCGRRRVCELDREDDAKTPEGTLHGNHKLPPVGVYRTVFAGNSFRASHCQASRRKLDKEDVGVLSPDVTQSMDPQLL